MSDILIKNHKRCAMKYTMFSIKMYSTIDILSVKKDINGIILIK